MALNKKKENVIRVKNLPIKRNVNLIGEKKKVINLKVAIPMILIISLLIAGVGKFFVLDKLEEMYRVQAEVADLQLVRTKAYEKLNSYGDLIETYAHYTYSDLTYEELYRADRVEVLNLIDEVIDNKNLISLTLQENVCVIQTKNLTLGNVKDKALELMESDLVDYCTVTNANTGNNVSYIGDNQVVVAQVTIYLNERGYE